MKNSRPRIKTISMKLLIPVTLVITMAILGVGSFAAIQEKIILENNIKTQALQGIDTILNSMASSKQSLDTIKNEMSKNYVVQAKLVAELIEKDNEILVMENLQALAAKLGMDEIHVIDEKGIITSSTVREFIGFDMNSSVQSKEFLNLINDKTNTVVQEPQPRGTDKALFQYVGVSRIDKPGLVQIGMKPEAVQKVTDIFEIKQTIRTLKLSETGYFEIIDENGMITAHLEEGRIGQEFESKDKVLGKAEGDFLHTRDGIEKRIFFKQIDGSYICAAVPTSDYLRPLNDLYIGITISEIIAILACFLITYYLSVVIVRKPLKKIMALMAKAEKGDLTVRSDNRSRDEIGQLAMSFNNMARDISTLIKSAIDMAKQVSESADTLAATSEETAASTVEIANTIQQIAASTTEGASNVQNGAQAVDNLSSEIDGVAIKSKSMKAASDDTRMLNMKGMGSLKTVSEGFEINSKITEEVAQSVMRLSDKSRNIHEVTETISSIASQTNLLALNAAIEAARAGESGKGFAVVADEIRKLAEQSAKSTEDIDRIISDIKSETEQVVANMEQAGKVIAENNMAISETNEVFKDVELSNNRLIGLIEMVNESVQNMERGKNRIVELIDSISAGTEQAAAASQQAAATTEEQSAAVQEVTASAQELNDMARQLLEAASKFRVE